jgi:hypothetical protein
MAWIGNGVVMPTWSRAWTIASRTPRSRKVVAAADVTSVGSASVVRVVALVVGIQCGGRCGPSAALGPRALWHSRRIERGRPNAAAAAW